MFARNVRHVFIQTRVVRPQRRLATLAEEVLRDETFHIPVVSFAKFRQSNSIAEKTQTANEVVTAFKEVGFVYLKDHGVAEGVIDNAFKKSAEFFGLPIEEKSKLAWEDPRANRGYVARGRERVTQETDAATIAKMRAAAPDAKETMEIGRDWDPTWRNRWPKEELVPNFKSTFLDFFRTCHELHVDVMRSIAIGLELEEKFFDNLIHEQYHNLRLLNYPSIPTTALREEGQARAGAHSDYGTLTFVFQDRVGGLQVQNPHTKQYHPATPIGGTIVVNIGDLLARWSNDVLRSTLHRVVSPPKSLLPPDAKMTPQRQSIAFFCNPNGGANISCLPNCLGTTGPKYPPVTTQDYIVGRLSDTYS
ncbi:Clavaminate synthase-like protein [Serendipita vermifera]|nr:Clavaminate synthase-like protein [Serendipita vermifera]